VGGAAGGGECRGEVLGGVVLKGATMPKKQKSTVGGRREGAGRPVQFDAARKITVVLPGEQVEQLRDLADQRQQTISVLMREAISRFLHHH
jgi:hypothetical protein